MTSRGRLYARPAAIVCLAVLLTAAAGPPAGETTIGYADPGNFASQQPMQKDQVLDYYIPMTLHLNQWALGGFWIIGKSRADLLQDVGEIAFQSEAGDLHLQAAPSKPGDSIQFRVMIDGQSPGAHHGASTDNDGFGVVDHKGDYALIRLHGVPASHLITIQFLGPGVSVYSFTLN